MSVNETAVPRLDAHLGKFSQASTFVLAGLAFALNQPVIVLITALILALSAAVPTIGPYRLVYRYILVPLRILRPRIVEDDPAPHRFAQGVGTVFLLASWLTLFLTHATALGWVLDLIVFVLSGLNLFVGFCAGCFVYYHLGRLGITPHVRYEGGFHWRGV
jgi:Domain of unknown function (DUF4395)